MASPINNYQASALAARLAATYLTNQNNVNAPANTDTTKPAADAKDTSGNATSDGTDGVILSLSDEAKQLLASLQQGLQPNTQPTSLAAFLNSSGQNDNQQNDLISAYSGAIKQFQQWLSQPSQTPPAAQTDPAPAKTADGKTDDKSSVAPSASGDGTSSSSDTSGSGASGTGAVTS